MTAHPSPAAPAEILAGMIFERPHPFTWVSEGEGEDAIERWRPGAWNTCDVGPEESLMSCTALGRARFTVVSTHRPPGYPERVFFTREFTCPDGRLYAAGKLMNCVTRKFRKDVVAFPFAFDVEDPSQNLGAAAPDASGGRA